MQLMACNVDLDDGNVVRDGRNQRLTELERRLLAYLASHPERDIAQSELLTQVWGYARGVNTRAVTATVHRLRAKVERDPSNPDHIVTVWGRGLRFTPSTPSPPNRDDADPLDRYFGRADLLKIVGASIVQGRLITLVGPGGIGKTRLAREVVRRAPEMASVVVEVTDATSATGLVREVAQALDVRLNATENARDALAEALADRGELLLVLDDLEGTVDAAAEVVPAWLSRAPGLTVLGTSREGLHIAGEDLHRVGPLDHDAARELFLDRMPHDVQANPIALRSVLDRLDGMPLAIELAARLTDVLPLDVLAARLVAPLDVLTAGRRDRPPRHRSLRRALQGSWECLDESHQDALATLSVCEGAFDIADAEALLGPDAVSVLRGLGHKSLVQRVDRGHRLLQPVRVFAREHRSEAAQRRDATSWLAWLSAEAGRRFDPSGGPPQQEDLAWSHSHLADLQATWSAAVETDPVAAAALAGPLHVHHLNVGPPQASVRLVTRTLTGELGAVTRGHLLRYLGHAQMVCGQRQDGCTAALEALRLAEETRDPRLEGRVCSLLMALGHDESDDADTPLVRRTLLAHERADDGAALASTLGTLAGRHWFASRFQEASDLYERAVALHREHHNRRNAAVCLANRGTVLSEVGDHERARRLLHQALHEHQAVQDHVHEANTLSHLGLLALKESRFDEAVAWLDRSTQVGRSSGVDPVRIGTTCYLMGAALALRGDLGRAATALRLSRRFADRADQVFPMQQLLLAWVEALGGEPARGRALLAEPPPTDSARQERVSGVLRALLLLAVDEERGRPEAIQLLQWCRHSFERELPISEAWRFLDRLEIALTRP